MINLLAKKTENSHSEKFSVNRHTRVYCIGDIHGRADLLNELHEKILVDAEGFAGDKLIVYLGDYIDRGLQSKAVIDLLINHPLEGFQSIFLRGNHEQILLDFLNLDPSIVLQWFNFGGQATMLSYGVSVTGIPVGEKIKQLQSDLADKLPDDHLHFINQLKFYYENGGYFFVHAGVKPKCPLIKQQAGDMMWIRDEFLSSTFQFEKMIVHGHSIVDQPEQKINRIAIDTGAYISGCLTSLVLEGHSRRYLQTGVF